MSAFSRAALLAFAFAAAFLAATRASFAIPFQLPNAMWLLPAIALYACREWGGKLALFLGIVFAVAYWSASFAYSQAIFIGIGISLQAVLGAALLKRFMRGADYFFNIDDIFHFVWIAALSSTILASLVAFFLGDMLAMPDSAWPVKWLAAWLESTAGLIIFTPMLLTARQSAEVERQRLLEIIFFAIALPIITHVSFGDVIGQLPLAFLPLGFVLWAALRFSPRCCAFATATVCLIAIYDTTQGHGPFSRGHFNQAGIPFMLLLSYISIVQVIGLSTSALFYQRKSAETALRKERDNLEKEVQIRTQELRADIAKREQIEAMLRDREIQLGEAQQLANMGSWNKDMATGAHIWSDELYRIYGVSPDEKANPETIFRERLHPDDYHRLLGLLQEAAEHGQPFRSDHRIVLPNDQIKIVATRTFPVVDASGKVIRIFGTVQDVTERRLNEEKLKSAERRYRQVVELSPDPILIIQDSCIALANKAAVFFVGAERSDELEGQPIARFFSEDQHAAIALYISRVARGEYFDPQEARLTTLSGTKVDVEIRSTAFTYEAKSVEILIFHDITERVQTMEKMARLAHYDTLTGLPNRILFQERLAHAMNLAVRHGTAIELLFIDVDKFKQINDTLGHAAGDQVLKELAARMRLALRQMDTVARLAGDEFVILLEGDGVNKARGGAVARKILQELERPALIQKQPLMMTVSIGISCFPMDAADAATLLEKADEAMYMAKKAGRSDYRYFGREPECLS